MLELRFSPRCAAGWARVYLYPAGIAAGFSGALTGVTAVAGDGTASGFTGRIINQVLWVTNVIAPHGGCLGAAATVHTADGATTAATIPCQGPLTSRQ